MDRLHSRHRPFVDNWLARSFPLLDYDRRQTAITDAFLQAFAFLHAFRGECSFRTFVSQIAFRRCQDQWRKQRRQFELEEARVDFGAVAEFLPSKDPSADIEQTVVLKEYAVAALRAWKTLAPIYQEILVLEWIGATYEDMRRILRVPLGTVQSRLSRARLRLKEAIREQQGGKTDT